MREDGEAEGEICGGFFREPRVASLPSVWLVATLPRAQSSRGTSCLLIRAAG